MSAEEDKHLAIEVIKEYIEKCDARYIAKLDVFLCWTGAEWDYVKMAEIVRIVRAVHTPLQLQRYVNKVTVLMAAQEIERVYEDVSNNLIVKEGVFSTIRRPNMSDQEFIVFSVLRSIMTNSITLKLKDISLLIDNCCKLCDVPVLGTQKKNSAIKSLAEYIPNIEVRLHKNRYFNKHDGRLYSCVLSRGNWSIPDSIDKSVEKKIVADVLLKYQEFISREIKFK